MTRKLRDAIGKCGGRVFQLRHSQVALMVKNPPINAGDIRDAGSIPGLGRSPGVGNGNLIQYSWQESLSLGRIPKREAGGL